ncbi:hypothetical protein [Rhodococcus sp. AQ5-07]|uniref:hypothetical protein n=1 Tax=Rhodococcus sp. AQ5-07 TaxID=2054902 RepID=UPI000DC034EC|nr:hypothetical protein [Rhodococcus sp. AQ5-07]RAL31505.1 hypothetical protein CVN56_27785 [Rhodococcus sp. AQ5-07]
MEIEYSRYPSGKVLVHTDQENIHCDWIGTVIVDKAIRVPVISYNGRELSLIQLAVELNESSISWQEFEK